MKMNDYVLMRVETGYGATERAVKKEKLDKAIEILNKKGITYSIVKELSKENVGLYIDKDYKMYNNLERKIY